MRRLLCIFPLLMAIGCAKAASPGFSSFDQTFFSTNNLLISFRSNSLPTLQATNLYVSNFYATNIYSSNIYTTNIYATNIYVSTNVVINTNITINSNIVVTYADMLWTNIGGIVQPTVGTSVEVTNLLSYQKLWAFDGFYIGSQTKPTLTNGLNIIDTEFTSYIPVTGASTTATDSYLTFVGGSTIGQRVWIENYGGNAFCITNNTPLSGSGTIKLSNGDWCPTVDGETLALLVDQAGNYVEIGRALAQTNLTAIINPTLYRVPYKSGTNTFGDSSLLFTSPTNTHSATFDVGNDATYWTSPRPDLSGVFVVDDRGGGVKESVYFVGTITSNALSGSLMKMSLTDADGGDKATTYVLNVDNVADSAAATPTGEPTDGAIGGWISSSGGGTRGIGVAGAVSGVATNNIGVLALASRANLASRTNIALYAEIQDPDIYSPTQMGVYIDAGVDESATPAYTNSMLLIDNRATGYPLLTVRTNNGEMVYQIDGNGNHIFGPGTTNVLYRSDTSLVYTNGAYTNFFKVINGLGRELQLGFTPSGNPYLGSSVSALYTDAIVIVPGSFQPNGTTSIGINSTSGQFQDEWLIGTSYLTGHGHGTTNYSRLAISHSGTNGVGDGVIYDSQASGTAGTPRPHNFQTGGTNVFRVDSSAGAGETRLWLWDEDNGTLERVTVGVPDSGGAGYKLLRIPN